MNIFDRAGDLLGSAGSGFTDNWGSIAVGLASVGGFVVGGGPIGGAVAGALAGALVAKVQGENVGGAALMGGGLGLVGGGVGAGALGIRVLRGIGRPGYVRANVPRFGPGMIGAGVGSGLGYALGGLDSLSLPGGLGGQASGYPEIPVKPIGEDVLPFELQPLLMPDSSSPEYNPEGDPALEYVDGVQQYYLQAPEHYAEIYALAGKDPENASLPEEYVQPGRIEDPAAAGIPNYTEKHEELEGIYGRMREEHENFKDLNVDKTTEQLLELFKDDIVRSVVTMGELAKIHPADQDKIRATADASAPSDPSGVRVFLFPATYGSDGNLNENSYTMAMLEGSYRGMESIVSGWAGKFTDLANEINPPKEQDDPKTPDTPKVPQIPYALEPTFGRDVGPSLQPPAPIDLGGGDDMTAGAGGDSAEKAAQDRNEALRRELEQLARQASTGAGLAPPITPATAMGGDMALPMMMQAMMANQQRAQIPDEPRLRRPEEPGQLQPDMPVTAPVPGVVPQANPQIPAPPAPAQPNTGRPPTVQATPAQHTTGKPAERGAGNVLYTFPDGRTQEVSGVVAQVLDAALANASGTDARAAYAKTKVTWTDEKDIGERVSYPLMTGDVGIWAERTAVLVVIDPENTDRLEAVVDGQVVLVTDLADMRDGKGEFGDYVGFFRPPGIEKAAEQSAVSDTEAAAPPVDQPVAVLPA